MSSLTMAKRKTPVRFTRKTLSPEDRLRRKCDRIAVKCVTIVSLRMIGSGSGHRFLGAYDGIEACREIRELLVRQFS